MTGCQKAEKTGHVEIVDLTGTISEDTLFPARYKSVNEDFVIVFSNTDVPIRQYGDAENQYIILVTPNNVFVLRDAYSDSHLNEVASKLANSIKGLDNEEAVMPIIKEMDDIIMHENYKAIGVFVGLMIFAGVFTILYLISDGFDGGYSSSSTSYYYFGSRSRGSYGHGGVAHR